MDILIKVVEGIKKVGYDGQVKGKKKNSLFLILFMVKFILNQNYVFDFEECQVVEEKKIILV